MKNLFVDTNVIIDIISYRIPFYGDSAKILDFAAKGRVKLFISALSYANIYYIARKSTSHQDCITIMKDLSSLLTTIDVTKKIIDLSIASSFKDFEDAIQYFSAVSQQNIDAIITRNPKDFKLSEIPLLFPKDVLVAVK